MTRRFSQTLALLAAAGVANGKNACLELTGARCQATVTSLSFVGCDLVNDDLEDLAKCFDSAGRGTINGLYMTGNSMLTLLPKDIFDGFGALRDLWLDGMGLTELDAGQFNGLGSLSWLRLDNNALTAVEPGAFDDLDDLEILTLDSNNIASIPAGLFDGRDKLEQLDLSSNRLTSLPPTLFGTSSGLDSLKSLFLNMNGIILPTRGLFGGLRAVSTLGLSFNAISALPLGLFDGLKELKILTLDDNSISTLPNGIFDGLSNLEILYLNDNELQTFEVGILHDLEALNSLNLRGNSGLQCLPALTGTNLISRTLVAPDEVGDTCACPEEGAEACTTYGCEPGSHGYVCAAEPTTAPTIAQTPGPTPGPTLGRDETETAGTVDNNVSRADIENGAGIRATIPGASSFVYSAVGLLMIVVAVGGVVL